MDSQFMATSSPSGSTDFGSIYISHGLSPLQSLDVPLEPTSLAIDTASDFNNGGKDDEEEEDDEEDTYGAGVGDALPETPVNALPFGAPGTPMSANSGSSMNVNNIPKLEIDGTVSPPKKRASRHSYSFSKPGTGKRKPKRKRTTPEQLECLVSAFEVNDSPGIEVREALAKQCDMTAREVQVWFQNRRAKLARLEGQPRRRGSKASPSRQSISTRGSSSTSANPPGDVAYLPTGQIQGNLIMANPFEAPAPLQFHTQAGTSKYYGAPDPTQGALFVNPTLFAMPGSLPPHDQYHTSAQYMHFVHPSGGSAANLPPAGMNGTSYNAAHMVIGPAGASMLPLPPQQPSAATLNSSSTLSNSSASSSASPPATGLPHNNPATMADLTDAQNSSGYYYPSSWPPVFMQYGSTVPYSFATGNPQTNSQYYMHNIPTHGHQLPGMFSHHQHVQCAEPLSYPEPPQPASDARYRDDPLMNPGGNVVWAMMPHGSQTFQRTPSGSGLGVDLAHYHTTSSSEPHLSNPDDRGATQAGGYTWPNTPPFAMQKMPSGSSLTSSDRPIYRTSRRGSAIFLPANPSSSYVYGSSSGAPQGLDAFTPRSLPRLAQAVSNTEKHEGSSTVVGSQRMEDGKMESLKAESEGPTSDVTMADAEAASLLLSTVNLIRRQSDNEMWGAWNQ
ncbi:hypothetical protein BJ742DRAFT_25985 [Cladochytrium replicatum]|nr:hypothetical protein BJ742DRAFT_25985 [Cladochytrium replicatum]